MVAEAAGPGNVAEAINVSACSADDANLFMALSSNFLRDFGRADSQTRGTRRIDTSTGALSGGWLSVDDLIPVGNLADPVSEGTDNTCFQATHGNGERTYKKVKQCATSFTSRYTSNTGLTLKSGLGVVAALKKFE